MFRLHIKLRMKRLAIPSFSRLGESVLRQYEQTLHKLEKLTPATGRNYLSNLRQFMASYEMQEESLHIHWSHSRVKIGPKTVSERKG